MTGQLAEAGREPVGVADDPGREHAAAAAASDEQVLRIDEALRQHGVNARHEVVVVLAGYAFMMALPNALPYPVLPRGLV